MKPQASAVDANKRLGWVDLAKGICILIVVFDHCTLGHLHYFAKEQLLSFFMPLFFLLSGLFFRPYENFWAFLKRKINKLMVPFVFFLVLTSMLPFLIGHRYIPWEDYLFESIIVYNSPLWFLLCLFFVSIMFYFIHRVAKCVSGKYYVLIALLLSFAIGYFGIWLGIVRIRLCLYLDAAFTLLPFYAFGWWLFNSTDFISSPISLKRDLPIAAISMIVLWLFAVPYEWFTNKLFPVAVYELYLCGIAGSLLVLVCSKWLVSVKPVSTWGRFSLVILCVHYPILIFLVTFLSPYLHGYAFAFVAFLIVMGVTHFMIAPMVKYLPHVTGQKNLIKV